MLSATCHQLHFGIVPCAPRLLLPNATSALESKMVYTDPNPVTSDRWGTGFCVLWPSLVVKDKSIKDLTL